MRFCRYIFENGEPQYGWIHDDMVGPIQGNIYDEYIRRQAMTPLTEVQLLPPVEAGKIICVGRNYVEHAQEQGAEVPEDPILFLKPPSSLVGHQSPIILPPQTQRVEHEGELAVVIGKKCRWVAQDEAMEVVFGFTIANDVTARDLQRKDGQWTRGKGFDTFCPLGPWIETELDVSDVIVTCKVNGEVRQMASTRTMVFTVPHLIAFISSVMTLMPGDVILTGTPAGVDRLSAGDFVEVNIEGIGTLSNPVVIEKR